MFIYYICFIQCVYIFFVLAQVTFSNMPPSSSNISKNSADSEFDSKSCVKFSKTAAEFKWARLGSTWQNNYPISVEHPELGSWLGFKKGFGAGCRCCASIGVSKRSSFGQYGVNTSDGMQDCNFKKHAGNERHAEAVKGFLANHGCEGSVVGSLVAPPKAEYLKLCESILKGQPTCGTAKECKMTWTVNEAVKVEDQKHFGKAHSAALFRDEADGRLALRFRTVSNKLDEHSGFLGQEVNFGTGGKAITLATARVMKRACSRFVGAPYKPKTKGFVKKPLFKKFRCAVKVLTVDAAADETLSGEMMRSSALSGMCQRLTPNLNFLNRDKTHGSRRLVSRGWGADKHLKENVVMMAVGRGSMARIIQNSKVISGKYVYFCKTSFSRTIRARFKNLKAATHRYESMQKPLGRSVLTLYPMVKTASWTSQTRTDDAGVRAKDWLMWIDNERCLQSAMQADASDQTMAVTRMLDDENVDASTLRREIPAYINSIEWLFGESRKCLEVFGYTKTMLDTLKSPIVFHIGKAMKTLGGEVPEEVICRCFERMRCWITLMKATCLAEFPSYEITHALALVVI